MYLNGKSVTAISRELGASREGIYQWIRASGIDPLSVDAHRRKEAQQRLSENKVFTPDKWIELGCPRCAICRKPMHFPFRRTCGGECAQLWIISRLYIDPDIRGRQRIFQARSNLKRGIQLVYSQHVLDGSLDPSDPAPCSQRVLAALDRVEALSKIGSAIWAEHDSLSQLDTSSIID
jgi:hypothetical protein